VIAEESGEFTIDDVAADIIAKMVRRNPHVFGTGEGGTPEQINEVWESIKREEKQRTSVTEGLPPGLPALLYADKVLDRLEREGRIPVVEPVEAPAADVGSRLLALVAEARAAGIDPEQALRDAVRILL
jgi:XTP/dITP diphosphohydrolase